MIYTDRCIYTFCQTVAELRQTLRERGEVHAVREALHGTIDVKAGPKDLWGVDGVHKGEF